MGNICLWRSTTQLGLPAKYFWPYFAPTPCWVCNSSTEFTWNSFLRLEEQMEANEAYMAVRRGPSQWETIQCEVTKGRPIEWMNGWLAGRRRWSGGRRRPSKRTGKALFERAKIAFLFIMFVFAFNMIQVFQLKDGKEKMNFKALHVLAIVMCF